MDGQERMPQNETGNDVGSTGDGGEVKMRTEGVVHVVELLGKQGRTGRKNRACPVEGAARAGVDPRLLKSGKVFGARSEMRDPLLARQGKQRLRTGMKGRTFVEHDDRSGGQSRNEPVPHHPADGGVVEEAFARPEIDVKTVLLEMLEENPAVGVDDPFGSSGRPRREKDVERMIEGNRREDGRSLCGRRRRAHPRGRRLLGTEIGHKHRRAVETTGDLDDTFAHVVLAALVTVTVGGNEKTGRHLPEAVEHPLDTEIARGPRPDEASGGRGQHGGEGFGQIGKIARDAFPAGQSESTVELLPTGDVTAQIPPCPGAAPAALVAKDKGRIVFRSGFEKRPRVVELSPDEPARARHRVGVLEDTPGPGIERDGKERGGLGPEPLGSLDRPAPENVGIGAGYKTPGAKAMGKARNLGARGLVRRRRPDERIHDPTPARSSAFSSAGTIVKRSPTSPTSAILKIGASGSLLIAAMTRASLIPVTCWMAPEIPTAM